MMPHSSVEAAQRRHANFFHGTASAPHSHDGSYQHLRAELGEENTNRLITNIGTLAMTSGLEASGVSLSDAVKRIIGSLTPAERSAIASGGAPPPRVQALLDSELKAAQQQQRQAQLAGAGTTNSGETGPTSNRQGMVPAAFAAMDREMRGRGSRSSEYSELRTDSISSANYASSQFARTGLNYAAFSDLRRQGFNAPQIMAAVRETQALRIDTNRNAAPMARVQRDIPSAIPGLHQTRDNWSAVRSLEDQQKKAQESGNGAAAGELARRIEDARKRAEEHDRRERERVQRERPDRAHDHRQLQDSVRRSALGHEARPEVRHDARVSDAGASVTRQQSREADVAAPRMAQADQARVEQHRARNAALLEDAPAERPTTTAPPTQQAAAETPSPARPEQPASAPTKTAEAASSPGRQQTPPPRRPGPTASA